MNLINLEQVTKRYINGADCVIALHELSLSVKEGTFLGVMGPSGSGKSTLLSVLGCLTSPSSGKVDIDSIDVYGLSTEQQADFRREYIGFIFQSHNLIPYLNALENVMLPLAVTKFPSAEKRQRASAVLERVGLADRMLHLPQQLSGGEQQRTGIARAIVTDPTLLLCDEPTGDLDRKSGDEILDLLQALNKEQGKTIIMVTHDIHAAARATRTLHLNKGQLSIEAVD